MEGNTQNKTSKGKILVYGTLAGLVMYAGGALGINRAIGNGMAGAKNAIVDVFTYDAGERADDLVKKIKKMGPADRAKYESQLQHAAMVTTSYLPESKKGEVIMQVVNKSGDGVKKQILFYSVDQNLDALKPNEVKKAYNTLDDRIAVDNRKNATGVKKLWYKATAPVEKLYNKIAGK